MANHRHEKANAGKAGDLQYNRNVNVGLDDKNAADDRGEQQRPKKAALIESRAIKTNHK